MILLKNARIVQNGSKHHDTVQDILISNGKIELIETNITHESAQVIDYENLHVSIGWIDSSVSFGSPGFEERQSIKNAIKTAASSGFTSVFINPNNNPNPENASGIRSLKTQYQNDFVNVYPVGNLTLDQEGEHLAELYDMHEAGAVSFYDFKKGIINANLLKVALQYSSGFNGLIQSYPENKEIAGKGMTHEDEQTIHLGIKSQPALAESLQVARDIEIARYTNSRIHFPTISTVESLEIIKAAKASKIAVSCSISVNNLALSTEVLKSFDTNYKLQPPLRDQKTVDVIENYILDGTIDMITSDHIPLNIEHKDVEFDHATPGSVGLESSFGTINKAIGFEKAVQMMTGAYDIFKLEQLQIKENKKAVLTLFNPDPEYTFNLKHVHSSSKNSAIVGEKLKGIVYGTIKGKFNYLNESFEG